MKTNHSITFVVFLMAFTALAQIPNGGFENWANGKPTGWFASNFGSATPITQVNNAHSGSSAMKMQFDQIFQTGAVARCPDNPDPYFPYAGRPHSISGWYISSFTSSDHMNVSCTLSKNGNIIGFASTDIYTVTSVYKQFFAPITYSVAGNSDSARVDLIVFGNGFTLVDDLQFETTVNGIDQQVSENNVMLQLITDPTRNQAKIEYENKISGHVKLFLCDLSGKIISNCVDQYQDAGRYRVYESLDALPEGIYFVRFESPNGIRTQKFCVVK